MSALAPEDAKLVTLARATQARTGAPAGAAIRDLDGRTYAAAQVELPHLSLGALAACVAMAYSSGASGLEAAVVLSESEPSAAELAVLTDLAGTSIPVHHGDRSGAIRGTLTS